jgi:hypothetical protein
MNINIYTCALTTGFGAATTGLGAGALDDDDEEEDRLAIAINKMRLKVIHICKYINIWI